MGWCEGREEGNEGGRRWAYGWIFGRIHLANGFGIPAGFSARNPKSIRRKDFGFSLDFLLKYKIQNMDFGFSLDFQPKLQNMDFGFL